VDEFRTATGYDGRVLSVEQDTDAGVGSLVVGHAAARSCPPGLHIHANWESRPGIPGRLIMARRLAERLSPSA
jgi:hypothetical protein